VEAISMSGHQDLRDVVVILCDQLRCDFLSLYDCRAIPTPNLDRLSRQGVVFDRAITASAVCGPARASMMTGSYPTQNGVQIRNEEMPPTTRPRIRDRYPGFRPQIQLFQ
jgi:arylsulfatase A-like enzyme